MVLDTTATKANNQYDNVFGELVIQKSGNDPVGDQQRTEREVKIECQVEMIQPSRYKQGNAGQNEDGRVEVTAERYDLAALELLDENGEPTIRASARLDRIEKRDGTLIRRWPDPPGMYVEQIQEDDWISEDGPLNVTWVCEPRNESADG